MEIVFVLFIVWLLITLVGHASWVIVRGLFRLIAGVAQPPAVPSSARKHRESDFQVTRRMILRMREEHRIEESEAVEMLRQLRATEFREPAAAMQTRPSEQPETSTKGGYESVSVGIPPTPAIPAPSDDDLPAVAILADAVSPESAFQQPAASAVTPDKTIDHSIRAEPPSVSIEPLGSAAVAPTKSVLSVSEVIQSFLSAHNIRWGELVAGVLIVVCSIGLVISLWSPLVTTHPVIPSLIFLGANATIYAAGLYTLSRWRLRHTSRAVLVIATLLVPLSVLAGLAATGTKSDAVPLTAPITLIAIAAAGLIYTGLLYCGGKALSRRSHALPMVMAVAGPVMTLPLVPAAIRNVGSGAGWFMAIGSASVFAAAVLMNRLRSPKARSIGPAGSRVRLLLMGFGAFSLAVAIAYLAFWLAGHELVAILPLAIASIPALIALAGMSRSIMVHARSSTWSMVGAVSLVLLTSMAWMVMPPSLLSPVWLWTWALTLGLSSIAVGFLFLQPAWLGMSTLPIGIAAVLTSKVWIAGHGWSVDPFWTRVLSGEAMIASALMAIASGIAFWAISKSEPRRWMERASIGWGGLTIAIASILAVAPVDWLGVIPGWIVTFVLLASVLMSFHVSLRDHRAAYAAASAATFAWLSILRPSNWFAMDAVKEWMFLGAAVAATLLLMREAFDWLAARKMNRVQSVADRGGLFWVRTAMVSAGVAALAGMIGVDQDWIASAVTLSVVATLVLWASSITGSVELVRGSQIATIALAGVIGYARFDHWLLGSAAWSSGRAMWSLAIAAGLVAAVWWLIRATVSHLTAHHAVDALRVDVVGVESSDPETVTDAESVASARRASLADRCSHLSGAAMDPIRMPDGWIATLAIAMSALGAGYFFATQAIRVGTSDLQLYEPTWGLPMAAIGLVGLISHGLGRYETKIHQSHWLTASVMITAILWLACQLSGLFPLDSSATLIVSTTIAAISLFAGMIWLDRWISGERGSAFRQLSLIAVVLIVGVASTSLLLTDWYEPMARQQLAVRSSTIAVSLWWWVSSLGLLWQARKLPQPLCGVASVILFASAAAIVLPAFSLVPPVVGAQSAALSAMVWIGLTRRMPGEEGRTLLQPVIDGAYALVIVLGVATSIAATASIVLKWDALQPVFGPIGALLSIVSSVGLCSKPLRSILVGQRSSGQRGSDWFVSWPVGLSLLAGQIAWLVAELGWVGGVHVVEVVVAVWVATSIAALWTFRRSESFIDFSHVAGVAVVSTILVIALGSRSEWMPWLALASLIAAGVQVALVAIGKESTRVRSAMTRLVGWIVGGAGVFLLVREFADWNDVNQLYAVGPLWLSFWVVVWRLFTHESLPESERRERSMQAIPDMEFATLLMLIGIVETLFFVAAGPVDRIPGVSGDAWLWGRIVAYLMAAGSAALHASRGFVWTVAIGTLVAATSLLSVRVAIDLDSSLSQRCAWAALSSGFVVALISHWLPRVSSLLGRVTNASPNRVFSGLVQATWQNAAVVAMIGGFVAIYMMLLGAPAADIQLTIATVALASWAIAEMAEESNLSRLRYAAVGLGLVAIGLWASVDAGGTAHPLLAGSMRWLVAAVLMIPTLFFAVPKVLGQQAAERWRDALRMGIQVAAAAAVGSLCSMLVMEFALRDENGISGVPVPVVVIAAITLGILSGLAGGIAVASGPTSSWRERLNLSDPQRITLIAAAQVLAVLTWLHVFLCRPDWTFTGLREFWPYIVMALSFLTVGATAWARRHGDEVMSRTLKQTALYLPLLPVLGFWLSGAFHRFDWAFAEGGVRYDVLLVIGTIYYIAIASMWKGIMPRVAAIILGNAAWWVVLIQWPGWDFLSHPQIWLIPPAACVLVVSQLYSDRLDSRVLSAIRYATTLVIYVSSTADMLIQQIGTTLAGPIILILLALAGMLAGVVLRVQAFLYLGATFVFLGVTSMVWHAQRAFDSVWPWWVFGISTGLCLLIGLMAIEKYKPQLRQYANQLASWER